MGIMILCIDLRVVSEMNWSISGEQEMVKSGFMELHYVLIFFILGCITVQ